MLGAIIGDIAGSRYEHNNIKTKEFPFLGEHCHPTDDSMMTMAIADALLCCRGNWDRLPLMAVNSMQRWGRKYPYAGYGKGFREWLMASNPKPYQSYGNGAAMRVSPCTYAAGSLEEAKLFSRLVTGVTHNHPEGLKGGEAVTVAIWMALHGSSKEEIREEIKCYYFMDFTLDEIRREYTFHSSCQRSVPQAIEAFLESNSFVDAIRNAISIGGDSDTIAAIAGSIAEAYYGISEELREVTFGYLYPDQIAVIKAFESKFGCKIRN